MVLKVAKSKERKKPIKPQIEIFNNGKTDEYVNGIELTFDSYFTLFGTVEIVIGDRKILYDNDAEDFKQYRVFPVPVNSEVLKPYESIKIFVWNPLSDDKVTLAANIDIHDEPAISTLSGQAIDHDSILSEISGGAGNESDTHDIFPYQRYQNESKEFLINTKGRQNMLLTMASSNVLPPRIAPNNFTPNPKPVVRLKINSNVDNTPRFTGAVSNNGVNSGSIRNRNWNKQTEKEWYLVTDYFTTFRDVTLQNGVSLDSAVFSPQTDHYLLVDGQSTEDKQIRFNFNSNSFSQDIISGSMAVMLTRTKKYQRTRTVRFTTGAAGGFSTKKLILTSWTRYRVVSTNATYSSAIVTLRVLISFEIQVSDNINFTSYRKIKNINSNGTITVSFSEKYMRIKRIVTGQRLSVSYGNTGGGPGSINLPYPDITSNYSVTNLIDLQSHGGTAKLYFQLLGVNNQWFTILDYSQLGAITQGQSKLIRFNIAGIPPSQSRFKAVFDITGVLQTGVTIDLVA